MNVLLDDFSIFTQSLTENSLIFRKYKYSDETTAKTCIRNIFKILS